MKTYHTYSDYADYKLTYGQVFKIVDLTKPDRNTFTAWSVDQLHRLFEDGKIDNENYRVMLGKSAEMGYSSSIASRKYEKDRMEQQLEEMIKGEDYDYED